MRITWIGHSTLLIEDRDIRALTDPVLRDRVGLLRRIGSREEAAKSYSRALALVTNDSERRFLERRLRDTSNSASDA